MVLLIWGVWVMQVQGVAERDSCSYREAISVGSISIERPGRGRFQLE